MSWKATLGFFALGLGSLGVDAQNAYAANQLNEQVINVIFEMNNIFDQDVNQGLDNPRRGFLNNAAGVPVQVIGEEFFNLIGGMFDNDIINLNIEFDAQGVVLQPAALIARSVRVFQLYFNDNDVDGTGPIDFGNNQNFFEACQDKFNTRLNVAQLNQAQFDAEFASRSNIAAILVAEDTLNHSPSVFCNSDAQCRGAREDDKFAETPQRICNGLGVAGEVPLCDTFVTFFTLRWLLAFIVGVYIILLLWTLYFAYPYLKKKFGKKQARTARAAKADYDENQQMIINTLAAQCASAENMLFQATDMLKQVKSMSQLLSVEQRRENKLMTMTVEYFQAMAAILVTLTHQYLDHKTFTPGEQFNVEDTSTRALQLEVLNYARDRLQLAFQAEAFTDKSLLRMAEAYAVLKKISDSLVLVGFTHDKEQDEGLGMLRTPYVEITENALFLGGIFKGGRGGMGLDAEGQEVCIAMKGADTRGMKQVGAQYYLSDSARDAKNYDPQLQTVKGSTGRALVYNLSNAGTQGETLQYFVRTFWGPEIAQIQSEATSWLTNDANLDAWMERERAERERKAAPVIKRGAKKKRKKNKKNKKGKYKDAGDAQTEITEYTEASGWSVTSNNSYVYSVTSVVNQGLGIAGKPGLPYDTLGTTHRETGKFFKLFETYFPNASEWPKFYIFIFVIVPFAIMLPFFVRIGQGSAVLDIDGNVAFKARAAGFGTTFLGVPAYYFLDGGVPDPAVDLEDIDVTLAGLATTIANDNDVLVDMLEQLQLVVNGAAVAEAPGPLGTNTLFMTNDFANFIMENFDGSSGRNPDGAVAEIQAGVIAQTDAAGVDAIRSQQQAQEVGTIIVYALMHNAGYFFGIVPLSLIRESLEILARKFPIVREVYPMSQWRDLHMNMGLAGIFYVTFGATAFLIMMLVAIGKSTPFAGLSGDPNIDNFFDFNQNVLFLRQLLLPFVPLLLLMKYASRGPPVAMRKYAPTFITINYWEICYFLHYLTALTAIIMLVLYRPQVFYWMGATWGFVWGGNKIVRILRTRKTTIKNTNLISYSVEDPRNNAKKRSDVLRITLNVPRSFPSSARGQACWLSVPEIDYIAHPFTLAKVPTPDDPSIMFHIGVKYLDGDDIISYARPEEPAKKAAAPAPANNDALPTGWKQANDPSSGQTYYYNSTEKRTTWTRPKNTAVDALFDGARALTSRFSTNMIRGAGSTRLGQVGLNQTGELQGNRKAGVTKRATWTQRLSRLGEKIQSMDPDLRKNALKDYPVYVSAPLGTSMDDCLLPSLPGSIIITTQNGLPAAESSVRWLLMQKKTSRPKFHFFVSVSREVNDALSVVETLRNSMCDSVMAGNIDIDGLHPKHAHLADWLGVYIHLTRRKPSQIEGDRDMLIRSLNAPAAPVTPQQLDLIQNWLKNRVSPGRLPFDRFLQRTSQMVQKRTGLDRIAVGYCGSAKIAYAIRAAAREIPNMSFDGEYI